MSMYHVEKLECPTCKNKSDFGMWDSVNTVMDPEMKEKVRSGEAFAWECPYCGMKASIAYSMLYHQMDDLVMIYYVPGDKTEAIEIMKGKMLESVSGEIKELVEEDFNEHFYKRVVGSQNELREKLFILDEGLDDHIIELMKLMIIAEYSKKNAELTIEEALFAVDDGGKRAFEIYFDNGERGHAKFIQEIYDYFATDMMDIIEADKEVVVDLKWALEALKKSNE